ncbi:MAG: hypothetical protein NPIRA06_05990 [Nitrospirales bacterium]|nr:MAG: hypothetical protein NPIRA06_05990 [Nitrospirales bacterium]
MVKGRLASIFMVYSGLRNLEDMAESVGEWGVVAMRLILTYRHFRVRKTIKHADRWCERSEPDQEGSESSEEHAA